MAARKKAAAKSRTKRAARKSTKAKVKTRAKTKAKTKARTKAKAKAKAKPKPKARSKAATKTPGTRRSPATQNGAATTPATKGGQGGSVGGKLGIRVRMYRIGFGDFFLLTVPGKSGPAHILIDCGVHAANIGSMDDCVKDMASAEVTNKKLALVILTHYHADHMSGFASNYDDFAQFEVGAVWITNRLDPKDGKASKFMAQITSVAHSLQLQLGARNDPDGEEAQRKVHNALGVELGARGGANGGGNAKALKLLQEGFKNKPPVYYYQGGDTPTLPAELEGKITADILAPSPKESGGEYSASDNKKEQYLAAAADAGGVPNHKSVRPFEKTWPASAADYPARVFHEFDSGIAERSRKPNNDGAAKLQAMLENMQPDVLAAAADKLDGTLNNQSLVVLFTCQGKKLLFVGDAQWGNWAYWLYGKAVAGKDPGITARAKEILGSIDFYKVGHHGSTNATPIPAVGALNEHAAAMCSTATGAYGSPAKKTEVPRTALMDALETKTKDRMVRSDWVPAGKTKPDAQAKAELADLPSGFTTPGDLYIDYNL
ncbi:MAG: MBL fold metallo-hydrolase [Reyranella sp.]|uniref:MBL fold metallo-hydrolase n=2 Tax=Pseudomonadota TaxID=1224 RepID=UPI001AC6DAEF|nr:MBL fold metallo-hydrolase [Reyranella sp.]MBN9089900.1 MBL fold metallo-hydrolase [Reyranella sp.]